MADCALSMRKEDQKERKTFADVDFILLYRDWFILLEGHLKEGGYRVLQEQKDQRANDAKHHYFFHL